MDCRRNRQCRRRRCARRSITCAKHRRHRFHRCRCCHACLHDPAPHSSLMRPLHAGATLIAATAAKCGGSGGGRAARRLRPPRNDCGPGEGTGNKSAAESRRRRHAGDGVGEQQGRAENTKPATVLMIAGGQRRLARRQRQGGLGQTPAGADIRLETAAGRANRPRSSSAESLQRHGKQPDGEQPEGVTAKHSEVRESGHGPRILVQAVIERH